MCANTRRLWCAAAVLAAGWLWGCSDVPAPRETGDGHVVSATGPAEHEECRPRADATRAQYVVGYGSLMQDASRKRTSPLSGPARPVEITGYRRGWYLRSSGVGLGTSFLAVVPRPGSSLNAVIYAVDLSELAATDRRESSYCRAKVALSNLRSFVADPVPSPEGEVWIYLLDARQAASPSESFPIAQSYVDIFIGGCLEQEERFGLPGFSAQCVRSTSGWSKHWVNDRIYPRRPFIFEPKARQIDELLAAEIPEQWSMIRIEGGERALKAVGD